jgi:hypothetical protein
MFKQIVGLIHQRMMSGGDAEDLTPQLWCLPTSGIGVGCLIIEQFAEAVNPPQRTIDFVFEDPVHFPMQIPSPSPDPGSIDIQHALCQLKILRMFAGGQPIGKNPLPLKVIPGDRMFFRQHG